MTTAPTIEKESPYALRLGRVTLRWIELATIAALAAPEQDGQLIRPIKRRLAAWRPLDEYKRRYAFHLGQPGRLCQWGVIARLAAQGLLRAPHIHAEVTQLGQDVARVAAVVLPAPLSSQDYARVMEMLYDAKAGRADHALAERLAREIITASNAASHTPQLT
jgi:chorismate mutase